MSKRLLTKIPFLPLLIWTFVFTSVALGAAPNDAVLKAKQEAESNGYIFVASRDEILAKAAHRTQSCFRLGPQRAGIIEAYGFPRAK